MSEDPQSQRFNPLRSITRLLLGGLILGSDAIQERLLNWEGQEEPQDVPEAVESEPQTPQEFNPLPDQLPPPGLAVRSRENDSDLRYALIGLLFEGEEQLEKGLAFTKRLGRFTSKAIEPLIRPVTNLPNPAQKSFDRLAKRGQTKIDSWVARGREEEYSSRQLAQEAAKNTVDESITYIAQVPALEELVQQQGVSLAVQIIGQIRESAVSADYFFESLVRYFFRRPPRYLLPPPSSEVQAQATWKYRDFRPEEL